MSMMMKEKLVTPCFGPPDMSPTINGQLTTATACDL